MGSAAAGSGALASGGGTSKGGTTETGWASPDAGPEPSCDSLQGASTSPEGAWPSSPTAPGGPCGASDPTNGEDGCHQTNVPSYSDGADVVTDSVTLLTWQRAAVSSTMTEADASAYCDRLVLDGTSDWRLPSSLELVSIFDYGSYGPALPKAFTVPTDVTSRLLSSSGSQDHVVTVSVVDGSVAASARTGSFSALCVRGSPLSSALRVSAGCATAVDRGTGLVWQRESIGLPSVDSGLLRTLWDSAWMNAMHYCETLMLDGHDDWRMASIKELATLLDERSGPPFLDPKPFAQSLTGYAFLSSTPAHRFPPSEDQGTSAGIWLIDFATGTSVPYSGDGSLRGSDIRDRNAWPPGPYDTYARCVRGPELPHR